LCGLQSGVVFGWRYRVIVVAVNVNARICFTQSEACPIHGGETSPDMFSAMKQATKTTRRGTFSRGTVHCPNCKTAIHLFKAEQVGEEFSASCSRCGRRAFHERRHMAIEQFVERRAKPRAA
jgi:ssDNA-binding Zn-finger/Zn-ribbon topoisomerase 1